MMRYRIPPSQRLWTRRVFVALVLLCGIAVPQSAASAEGPSTTPAITSSITSSLTISRPQPGETIHDNTGVVPVAVALQGVALAGGSRLRVLIDGKAHGPDQRALEFTLKAVERGEHTLQVQLLDTKDALLAASPAVTFYVWQASVLFPNR